MGHHGQVHGAPSMVPRSTFICHFLHNFFAIFTVPYFFAGDLVNSARLQTGPGPFSGEFGSHACPEDLAHPSGELCLPPSELGLPQFNYKISYQYI